MNKFKELQNVIRNALTKTVTATTSKGIYAIRIPADFCVNINGRSSDEQVNHKQFDLKLITSESETDDYWEIRIRKHK